MTTMHPFEPPHYAKLLFAVGIDEHSTLLAYHEEVPPGAGSYLVAAMEDGIYMADQICRWNATHNDAARTLGPHLEIWEGTLTHEMPCDTMRCIHFIPLAPWFSSQASPIPSMLPLEGARWIASELLDSATLQAKAWRMRI